MNTGKPFVDIHGMQQRLIESGLVLFSHQQHPIFGLGKGIRQFFFFDPEIHGHFGIGDGRQFVIFYSAGKGHQGLDGIAFLSNV